jgi:predicted transcriptional regulator
MTTVTGSVNGADVRRRRVELGLSRQAFAHEVPCSTSHLAALEQGLTPTRSTVLARADAALARLEAEREAD